MARGSRRLSRWSARPRRWSGTPAVAVPGRTCSRLTPSPFHGDASMIRFALDGLGVLALLLLGAPAPAQDDKPSQETVRTLARAAETQRQKGQLVEAIGSFEKAIAMQKALVREKPQD